GDAVLVERRFHRRRCGHNWRSLRLARERGRRDEGQRRDPAADDPHNDRGAARRSHEPSLCLRGWMEAKAEELVFAPIFARDAEWCRPVRRWRLAAGGPAAAAAPASAPRPAPRSWTIRSRSPCPGDSRAPPYRVPPIDTRDRGRPETPTAADRAGRDPGAAS